MGNRVVFLVGSYYPNYSAVGRCQGNIAEVFEKRGFDVTVLSLETKVDEAKYEKYGNQSIIRISNKRLSRKMRIASRKDSIGVFMHFLIRVSDALGKIFCTNSLRRDLVMSYYNELTALDFVPDLIIPTCLPFETLISAAKYKTENDSCKIIPVLYDMFAENTGLCLTDWNRKIKRKRNLSIESIAFSNCSTICHMPSWTSHINDYHPEIVQKCIEVEHPLIINPYYNTHKSKCEFGDCINLVYIGEINRSSVDPQLVIEYFCSSFTSDVNLHFYAYGNAVDTIKNVSLQNNNVYFHDIVDTVTSREILNNANILVSIGSKNSKYVQKEIFEYMSSGKPIVYFFYSQNDLTINVLKDYGLSLCIPISNCNSEVFNSFVLDNSNSRIESDSVIKLFHSFPQLTKNLMLCELRNRGIHLVFAGALNRGHVEYSAYIDLLSRFSNRECFKSIFYSAGNLVDSLKSEKSISISCPGWIPHDELEKVLFGADILVSLAHIHGKQISSKIFEYMCYGKPILHIYYAEDDVNLKYLNEYPLSVCVNANEINTTNVNIIESKLLAYSWLNLQYKDLPPLFSMITPEYITNIILKSFM